MTESQQNEEPTLSMVKDGENIVVTWTGKLQRAATIVGPYANVGTGEGSLTIAPADQTASQFFRAIATAETQPDGLSEPGGIDVIINEFMASNAGTLEDADGDSSDWFEVYNGTRLSVNLSGWHVTDDPEVLDMWTFPSGVILDSGQYMVVFASGKDRRVAGQELHTNFSLSRKGEYLALVRPDRIIAHEYANYPSQTTDVSYGVYSRTERLIPTGAAARVLVPDDDSLRSSWKLPGFNDESWLGGNTGIGYETETVYYDFHGSEDYIDSGTFLGDALGNNYIGDLTVSLWFKTDAIKPDNNGMFHIGTFNNANGKIDAYIRNDLVCFGLNNDGWRRTAPFTDTTSWHHYVSVYKSGSEFDSRLYLDGVEVGASRATGTFPSSSDMDFAGLKTIVGGYYNSSYGFNGQIRDIKVFPSQLTTGDVRQLYSGGNPKKNLQVGLVANGTFDNFTGWTDGSTGTATATASSNKLLLSGVDLKNRAKAWLTSGIPASPYTTYVLSWTMLKGESSNHAVRIGSSVSSFDFFFVNNAGNGDQTRVFNTGARKAIHVYFEEAGRTTTTVDDVTLQEAGTILNLNYSSASGYEGLISLSVEDILRGINETLYVRIPFQVDAPDSFDSLTLRMKYNDGFVAFLNGVKIAESDNAPTALTHDAGTTGQRDDNAAVQFDDFDGTAHLRQLLQGDNVLAIHALNHGKNSTNLLILPELVVGRSGEGILEESYFERPTPGRVNSALAFLGAVADTRFSVDRGFYSVPFDLAITTATEGATLYVTTDGSVPSVSNPAALILASGETLRISETSTIRAAAFKTNFIPTNTDTHTYIFLHDVIRQSSNDDPPPGWPRGPVAGQRLDYGMDPNIVNDPVWAPQMYDALTSISTISMVTDLDNLLHPSTGIYTNAGSSFERPASIELIHPDGMPGFQVEAGVRPRGNTSSTGLNPKHSFRLFFRSEYGDAKLRYPLFGDEGKGVFDKLDLRTAQNDSWARHSNSELTFVNDVFARDLQRDMGQPYTRSRYHHLYINGQYWGIYQSQERSEAAYGATYFGGRREDYDTIKATGNNYNEKATGNVEGYQTEVTDGNFDAWKKLWHTVRSGVGADADYLRLQGLNMDGSRNSNYPVLLNPDNLIDYMLGIFYTGDEDRGLMTNSKSMNPNNFFALRNRNGNHGFMFFAQDSEQSFISKYNREGLQADRVGPFDGSNWNNFIYSNPVWIHQDLMANAEYRVHFGDRTHRYFFNNGLLTPEGVTRSFLRRAEEIEVAIVAESARWGDASREPPYTKNDWQSAVDNLVNNYFPFRSNIVLDQLRNARRFVGGNLVSAPLYPSVSAPLLKQQGGRIEPGFKLMISGGSGLTFYSLDGQDPRQIGGVVSPSALRFTSATEKEREIPLKRTTRVMTRSRWESHWSALNEALFVVNSSALRVTELMFNPSPTVLGGHSSDDFEFIEFQNIGDIPLNLTTIEVSGAVRFMFPDGDSTPQDDLPPGGVVLIVKDLEAFSSRYETSDMYIAGEYAGKLSNSSEEVIVTDRLGEVILSFEYSDDWYPFETDGGGSSLEIDDPGAALHSWSDPVSWRPSALSGGTPGKIPSPSGEGG